MIRTYSELIERQNFLDRFEYLKLSGTVGRSTFGFDRFMNQRFYRSMEWLAIRDHVITRDLGCDLGVKGHEIGGTILVHHMNPISPKDFTSASEQLLNPEFLITTIDSTHRAIHFGNDKLLMDIVPLERSAGDTIPWKTIEGGVSE